MKNKIPLIVMLAIITLLTYVFFNLFERYEEIKDVGWSKKSLRNPYLAAEQFLRKNNINVTSGDSFEKMEGFDEYGTIFISDSRKLLTNKQVDNILKWLDKGGHLIITAPIYNKNKKNLLLEKFKVKNKSNKKKETYKNKQDSKKTKEKLSDQLDKMNKDIKKGKLSEKKKSVMSEDEITHLSFSGIKDVLKLSFSSDSTLSHPYLYSQKDYKKTDADPIYWGGNKDGTYFMQFNVGSGLLSVITDNKIWYSGKIDEFDNAYLLWILSGEDSNVALLYGASMPSIFYYIWKYASELMIAFFLWLFAWLLYRSRRFGKIRNDLAIGSQSISEHIKASSKYLWRKKKFDFLLEPIRIDIFKHTSKIYPYFNKLNRTEQTKLISDHSNVELSKVDIALNKPFDGKENEFARIISQLQIIRNSL